MQRHQPPGCIVDEHQQRAGWRTVLEPTVVAAVNLNQFAEACATVARLVDLRRALFAWNPEARSPHQRTNRLDSQINAMTFAQFLARQRRSEIPVALADQRQRPLRLSSRQLMLLGRPRLPDTNPAAR